MTADIGKRWFIIKGYECPCGNLKVTVVGKKLHVQGGWLKGQPATEIRCQKCEGAKRIAFDIVFVDKNGEPFHPQTKKRTTKKRKPKKRRESFDWSFEGDG